jgi:hypothetical protein
MQDSAEKAEHGRQGRAGKGRKGQDNARHYKKGKDRQSRQFYVVWNRNKQYVQSAASQLSFRHIRGWGMNVFERHLGANCVMEGLL